MEPYDYHVDLMELLEVVDDWPEADKDEFRARAERTKVHDQVGWAKLLWDAHKRRDRLIRQGKVGETTATGKVRSELLAIAREARAAGLLDASQYLMAYNDIAPSYDIEWLEDYRETLAGLINEARSNSGARA